MGIRLGTNQIDIHIGNLSKGVRFVYDDVFYAASAHYTAKDIGNFHDLCALCFMYSARISPAGEASRVSSGRGDAASQRRSRARMHDAT